MMCDSLRWRHRKTRPYRHLSILNRLETAFVNNYAPFLDEICATVAIHNIPC